MVKRMEEHHSSLSTNESMREKQGEMVADKQGANCDLPLEICEHAHDTSRTSDPQLILPSVSQDCSNAESIPVSLSDALRQNALMNLVDDSDSDAASVNYIDDLSTMAELRLEECSIDSCSLNSHTLGEVERESDMKGEKESHSCDEQIETGEDIGCSSEAKLNPEGDLSSNGVSNSELLGKACSETLGTNDPIDTKDECCDKDELKSNSCNDPHPDLTHICENLALTNVAEDGSIEDSASIVESSVTEPKGEDSPINNSLNSAIDIENDVQCLRQESNVASVNRSEGVDALHTDIGTTTELPVHNTDPGSESLEACSVCDESHSERVQDVCAPFVIYQNVIKPKSENIGTHCSKSVTFCDDLNEEVDNKEDLSEGNVDKNDTDLNSSDDDTCNFINEDGDDGDDSERTLDCSADDASEHLYESVNYESVPTEKTMKPASDSRSSRSSRSSHSSTVSGPWAEDRLYEDIVDLRSPTEGQRHLNDGEDLPFFSRRLQVHRQFSSSDSWGSEDFESYSSNEDEEKTQPHSPENFKQRLLRKREQWRERRQSSRNLKFSLRKDPKDSKDSKDTSAKEHEAENADTSSITENKENRLYRWFSLRKSNYDVERKTNTLTGNPEKGGGSSYTMTNGTPPSSIANALHLHHRMPRLIEEQEGTSDNRTSHEHTSQRRHQPPSLPPMPQGLSPEQIKRRHIVSSIVHSENNYVATLHRLVNDYKKPLEESKPPILSSNKLSTLFYRVTEILQSHTLFRIALTDCVRHWDKEEKIGDVFVASFSNAIVLDVYSDFINNFSRAMDVAKQESKKKSAFADFLKMRQITSNDRLSFFGLMVKPVQRFPQFILFLQDLLKHTPQGHHDRMSLQLALTQLESLAEMLNERKREAEQYQAFRDTLKHINTKFALRSLGDGNRYLLRQDNATQLEFNQNGMINKTKDRRLFLTNDLVICVSVVPKSGDDFFQHGERLSLKWAYPVADVEISDSSSSPTLSRLLAAGLNKSGSMSSSRIPEESLGSNKVESLVQEMNDLMHDYETLSRITALVASLKGAYEGLNPASVQQVGSSIQRAIHQKDEQMVWVDSCCLQFSVKTKEGKERETFTFQTDNPTVKKDWIVELRLAQLALDKTNSPAWDLPDHERTPSTKLPLFVKSLPVFSSKHQTEVKCGCCYTITPNRPSRSTGRQMMYLWLCSSDGVSSHLTIFHMQQVGLRELVKVDLTEMCVSALQHVPALGTGTSGGNEDIPLRSHTVWMGTDSHRLLVYSGLDPEKQTQLSSTSVPAAITTIKYHCDQVYVGLSNGTVQVYRRGIEGSWLLSDPIVISLGTLPITALLPISTHVYASCGNQVYVIDCFTAHVTKEFGVQHEDSKGVFLMAHSGIGLWIAQEQSSTICLYHTETFRHLQDINVASNVSRMLAETGNTHTPAKIFVTALIASKGLLWVGTNVGVALTIPLPRLEGIPIISGRANISFHAHLGPITFLLALQSQSGRPTVTPPPPDPRLNSHELSTDGQQFHLDGRSSTVPPTPTARLEKQQSDGSLLSKKIPQPRLKQQLSSPVMLRRRSRESREQSRRLSKTLPRNAGGMTLSGSQECDVYGLCGALLNVQNYEDDSLGPQDCGNINLSRYDSMRRSDPELALPEQLSTLDRRVRLKASRPRSLDLSTWSVDSRASSACTTVSSGSEESAGGGLSPSVTKRQTNGTPQQQRNGTLGTFKRKESDQNRTLMVVVGGRGYINWQRPESGTPMIPPNTKDAHIIVWEMKL